MSLARREARGIALRLLFWLPILLWLVWDWGWHYADFLLPLYRGILDFALPDFGVVYLSIGLTHEYVFKAQVIAQQLLFVHGQVLPAGFTVDATTPLYIALIHPVVLAMSALAWPGLTWRGRLLRLLLSLPFLLLLEAMDVPLVLASSVNDLLSYAIDPQADSASMLLDWVRVMDGGGRFALCIAAALGAAGVHRIIRPEKVEH